jgi:hypothetical protein
MKTQSVMKTGVRLIVAMAIAATFTYTSMAAETKTGKGGASDLMSKPLRTTEDVQALQPGDTVAMACPKCKNIEYTRVTKEWKGHVTQVTPGTRHLCPGCENTFEVTGHGKAKKDVLVHKCSKCGSKDAFCCVVKGPGPTKGMEEKK